MAQVISIVTFGLAFIFSIPYFIINGRQTRKIPETNITGSECTVDDSYMGTIWPAVNMGFFIFLFLWCCGPLVVLYTLIGVTAWKHRKFYGVTGKPSAGQDSTTNSSNEIKETVSSRDTAKGVSISPRTRSYVKKTSIAVSSQAEGNCEVQKTKEDKDNKGEKRNEEDTRNYNDGDHVGVNMCMVRELAIKLKAVQKQSQGSSEDGSGDGAGLVRNDSIKVVKFHIQLSQDEMNGDQDKLEMADSLSELEHRKPSCIASVADGPVSSAKKYSKSMNDVSRLAEDKPDREKLLGMKPKAAEHEDIQLSQTLAVGANREEGSGNEDADYLNDKPESEFAKAMQWVDITYCLNESKDGDELANDGANDKDAQSEKGIFASMSRKVSRDNSFLQRHRRLRDALTDTLTRARKNWKDREEVDSGRQNENLVPLTNGHLENNGGNQHDDDDIIGVKRKQSEVSVGKPKKENSRKVSSASDNNGKHHSQKVKRRGIGRTTAMLILISGAYILSFLPFLGLMGYKAASPSTFTSMSLLAESMFNLFLRSYFLNCAANPIIYGLCDLNFRKECFASLKCS